MNATEKVMAVEASSKRESEELEERLREAWGQLVQVVGTKVGGLRDDVNVGLADVRESIEVTQTQTEAMVDQRIDTFTHILSAFEVRAALLAEQGHELESWIKELAAQLLEELDGETGLASKVHANEEALSGLQIDVQLFQLLLH